jgi:hypothetical protein
MALSSPGVEVKVIDESFYTPAEPGTVPLVVIASAENKLNGSGTGIAPGTLKSNAGKLYLITSQRDLVETFGDPVFKTDTNNNPVHASEQNEYGLQAAYSLLGVSNRAFMVRADLDLNQLSPTAAPPVARPKNGTFWLDTQSTTFGIFEWNGAPARVRNGQTYTNKVPLVLTDPMYIDQFTGAPLGSVGVVGDYAIVFSSNWQTLEFESRLYFRNRLGTWVLVGSPEWAVSWPTVAGSKANFVFADSGNFFINGTQVAVLSGDTLQGLADKINDLSISNGEVTAAVVNNRLELYHSAVMRETSDSSSDIAITLSQGINSNVILVGNTESESALGIAAGVYFSPKLEISKHTQIPAFRLRDTTPRPTGSLWIKTTQANLGARWRVKRYNGGAQAWEGVDAPIFTDQQTALREMDPAGGGLNLPVSSVFVKANFNEDAGLDDTPTLATFKLMRRSGIGDTVIRSPRITAANYQDVIGQELWFTISESLIGTSVLSDYNRNGVTQPRTIRFIPTGTPEDAVIIASAINSAGLVNVSAEVDTQNRLLIKHKNGGEIRLSQSNESLVRAGYSFWNPVTKTGTQNLYQAPNRPDDTHNWLAVASLWEPLVYTASNTAPFELTDADSIWYSSVIDEVDIMIHDGTRWVGYKTPTSPYYAEFEDEETDPAGPIIAASVPETQSDGTTLVTGDIWVDTSDIENYPRIYKFNAELENRPIRSRWELLDTADQSTENGVLFADARYNTSGANSANPGSIQSLLYSNFVDFDAPDPTLYPKGMLLWNLRRSGFNVKQFRQDYVDRSVDNIRYGAAPTFSGESMEDYYPHRWVTISNNQVNGAGSFGRHAQRVVVVRALQALVNSNQDIRDEESRVFNLISCPGYPELVGELVSLNYDRGLTAFVVADTPARLPSDATSLLDWGTNQRLALEDNDMGLVSSDEYLGFFYPWGFSSDNFGNNIAVPPSHMMLRTIALSDQVSYPWFAPAGVRRGGVTNATSVGYIDTEGEFRAVALNVGQRDTLASIKVNPITFITGTGLVNYAQFTRARGASSLDRINVARLVVYLRRQLNALAKPYIFEPNDKITRDEIKQAVESLLLELVGQRALYDFLVVCDESNNTPARIDRNELYIDIAIEPVKSVEFIYIPLRLKNTGEIKSLK